jgi:DNA-binding response OmpR family regulator
MAAKRILVIDDDALVRQMIRAMLEEAGFEVAEAADGRAGELAFKAGDFALVIVDVFMPVQDGLETIFAMDASKRGVPVLAISGGSRVSGMDGLRLARDAGADGVLEKAFTPEQLLASIRSLLAGATAKP